MAVSGAALGTGLHDDERTSQFLPQEPPTRQETGAFFGTSFATLVIQNVNGTALGCQAPQAPCNSVSHPPKRKSRRISSPDRNLSASSESEYPARRRGEGRCAMSRRLP